MLVGVKIGDWTPEGYVEEIDRYADFYEIYAKPDFDIDLPKEKPVIIHVAHNASGVNFANSEREDENQIAIDWARYLADRHGSYKIIFHPGLNERNGHCSLDNIIDFIGDKDNCDRRFLIENMPYSSQGFKHFCYEARELETIKGVLGIGFCFDLTHAAEYVAHGLLDFKEISQDFINLDPIHYHITGVNLMEVCLKDYSGKHLHFCDSSFNAINAMYRIPPEMRSEVTLETPQDDLEEQIREIDLLRGMAA